MYPYLDDILVASTTESAHYGHLQALFERLVQCGITVNADKCDLGKESISFLGHKISAAGIETLENKVQTIVDYPEPNSFKQLRRFMGLVNYYRRFIPGCATVMQPLSDLLRGKQRTFVFTDAARSSFATLKEAISNIALLAHPDPDAPISLVTDASDVAVGAVLQQYSNGSWEPLGFFSKRLQPAEARYSTFGRELLAIYLGIKHFRHSLEGREFTIFTDHKPLVYALTSSADRYSPREVRHLDFIAQFTTDIRHVSGVRNEAADALSRISAVTTEDGIDLPAMAEAQLNDEEIQNLRHSTSLRIQSVPLASAEGEILCDVSHGTSRPVVPSGLRRSVFNTLHRLSHPGIRSTVRLISARFVWPNMNRDIRQWSRACLQCQRVKVGRHTKSPLGSFVPPSSRFQHVHVDLVGPLPPSNGATYILTCVDRFTRWPEAIPIPDCSSETVARSFLERWVAHYGCPSVVTTDRGSHFEGTFQAQLNFLGCRHDRTTAYHPAANGLVERFHRQLKASIRAYETTSWQEAIPLALLGIRNTIKPDLHTTPAELVYGCTLRLPGELVAPQPCTSFDYGNFVHRLSHHMRNLQPAQTRSQSPSVYVPRELSSCTHIFLRNDMVRTPLQPPYSGPFRVLTRTDKTVTIDKEGKREVVSIDRVKPAFMEDSSDPPVIANPPVPSHVAEQVSQVPDASTPPTELPSTSNLPLQQPPTSTTSRGRAIRLPVRFAD